MKAVRRIFCAWRRFFFALGCNHDLHTVILNYADSDWRSPTDRILPPALFALRYAPYK
jgi:hypothetical protein